ncbi:putative NADH-flavin reductase [Mumia flava]|uniref:Putative NADH-flavin reductase n=1 Tax=Mumia flava TaxID=1348852 RepID=A0A0B2B631_9ACTN|nr:SDR family oxidoreductase [Mumia flava]PJJ53836.1 putative NADH-flavin reductase [Mumia flava]
MKIAIAGGHGQIALLLTRALAESGHQVRSLIRNPEHADEVRTAGAEPVVTDLEDTTATRLSEVLAGCDAVVFAAGAGPGSGIERKWTVDRDGAVLLAAGAQLAGAFRYVLVSSMGAGSPTPEMDEIFQVYLQAKGEAEDAVRDSALDWTIVRPGMLTDDPPTGGVRVGESVGRGPIPRADVAAVLAATLEHDGTVGRTFELISGETPIPEALDAL